jgi:hypothetical protein
MSPGINNRQPSPSVLGEGRRAAVQTNRRGSWQWTGGVCVGDVSKSDARVSGETCRTDPFEQSAPRHPGFRRPDLGRSIAEAEHKVENDDAEPGRGGGRIGRTSSARVLLKCQRICLAIVCLFREAASETDDRKPQIARRTQISEESVTGHYLRISE